MEGELRYLDFLSVTLYADLFRYGDLFLNLFRRELRVKYRGSVLGLGWTLVLPLALMGVYTIVFSVLLGAVNIKHYSLFLLSGLVTWVFFQGALQSSCTSLLGQASLVKQVRFPRQLLPFAVVGTNAVTFLVMLAVLVPVNLIVIPETRTTFWAALAIVPLLVALAGGMALVLAAVTVVFRDVEHLLTAILLPWFFLTPVFYTFDFEVIDKHPGLVDLLHYGNPVAPFVIAIRDPLFFGDLPQLGDVAYVVVAALAALGISSLVFRRLDDQLAAQL
jgi:lipopolysaccharide transport system permease protein